jgi:hypothetical protein
MGCGASGFESQTILSYRTLQSYPNKGIANGHAVRTGPQHVSRGTHTRLPRHQQMDTCSNYIISGYIINI